METRREFSRNFLIVSCHSWDVVFFFSTVTWRVSQFPLDHDRIHWVLSEGNILIYKCRHAVFAWDKTQCTGGIPRNASVHKIHPLFFTCLYFVLFPVADPGVPGMRHPPFRSSFLEKCGQLRSWSALSPYGKSWIRHWFPHFKTCRLLNQFSFLGFL